MLLVSSGWKVRRLNQDYDQLHVCSQLTLACAGASSMPPTAQSATMKSCSGHSAFCTY